MTVAQSKIEDIAHRYSRMQPYLNEAQRRLWAGVEAAAIGHGGVEGVARATGLAPKTVRSGRNEILNPQRPQLPPEEGSIRAAGAGRPRVEDKNPDLIASLLALVEPTSRGDPESPLRWTSKSSYKLAEELEKQGFQVSSTTVQRLLADQGFSLQAPRKTHEGGDHPDRDSQFNLINDTVESFQQQGQPVISVDAKKKELVGNFDNQGQEWQPQSEPQEVNVYDFPSLGEGKAAPYGVYDVLCNEGWVSVGMSADTAEFAVNSIRTWWERMGRERYPEANKLLITADCGGSNGYRVRLWKKELQDFANESGLTIHVMHYPPGTSKWNTIEHRLFNHITMNWRGRPLTSFEVVVNCIAATTTKSGLRVDAELDDREYERGLKVSDGEMRELNLETKEFHGEWNYIIAPQFSKSDN